MSKSMKKNLYLAAMLTGAVVLAVGYLFYFVDIDDVHLEDTVDAQDAEEIRERKSELKGLRIDSESSQEFAELMDKLSEERGLKERRPVRVPREDIGRDNPFAPIDFQEQLEVEEGDFYDLDEEVDPED